MGTSNKYRAKEKQVRNIVHLVKKAQRGDETAYLTLFQQFEEDIYRTAYVYLKNQDDALDVVQETAYRSFKAISSLKEPKYFKTWLIRITISCSIDLLRQRAKVIQLRPEYYEGKMGAEEDNLPLSLSLKDLIDLLDEDEKGVIILKFYHDYTIQQSADILAIPLGTAKTLLYRALKKLRRLTEEGDLYEQ